MAFFIRYSSGRGHNRLVDVYYTDCQPCFLGIVCFFVRSFVRLFVCLFVCLFLCLFAAR